MVSSNIKPAKLKLSKLNYIAAHEVNHLVFGLLYFIEQGLTKKQVRESVVYIKILNPRDDLNTTALGNIQFSKEVYDNTPSFDFIYISGCVGAYYYFKTKKPGIELDLDTAHSERIRDFIENTGGGEDLLHSKLHDSSLRNNYKLKKIVQKIKTYYDDEELEILTTTLIKRLKSKQKLGNKDMKNFINSNYSTLKDIVERAKTKGMIQKIKKKLSM